MKKVIIAKMVFLLVFSSAVFAQSGKFNLGIEGGAGISNVRGIFEPGFGYTGQVFCEYKLSKIFSTHLGLGYEQKGTTDEILATDINGSPLYNFDIRESFDFLTLPVLVRANFGSGINYFVNAGPYFNYLLKQTSKIDDPNTNSIVENDYTSNYNRFDTGFVLGVGLSFQLIENWMLSCEIRNNLGLSNLSKVDGASAKTNSTQLLVGLAYKL